MLSKTNQPFRNHHIPKTFPQNRLLCSPNRNFSPQRKGTPQHDPYMVCVRNVWLLDRKTAQNEESRRSIDKKIKVPLLIIGYHNGQHRSKLTSRRSQVHTCSVTCTQGTGSTGTRSVTYPQIVGHTGTWPATIRPARADRPGSPRIAQGDPPRKRGSPPRSRGSPRLVHFNKYNTNSKAPGLREKGCLAPAPPFRILGGGGGAPEF